MNGCFWHGHNECKYFVWPKNNAEFWRNKIETNIARDDRKIEQLRNMNWKVIVVWECQLRANQRAKTLASLIDRYVSKLIGEVSIWNGKRFWILLHTICLNLIP